MENMVRELLDASAAASQQNLQSTAIYIERALEIGGVPAGMNAEDHDGTGDSESDVQPNDWAPESDVD